MTQDQQISRSYSSDNKEDVNNKFKGEVANINIYIKDGVVVNHSNMFIKEDLDKNTVVKSKPCLLEMQ